MAAFPESTEEGLYLRNNVMYRHQICTIAPTVTVSIADCTFKLSNKIIIVLSGVTSVLVRGSE